VVWTAIGTLLLVGPGMVYTLLTWRKEHRVDIDITKREDRIVPLMLASLGALFGSYLVFSRLNNQNLYLMSVILVALLVSITIITSQWKISLHSTTFTALTTLLVTFGSPYFAFLYLLLFFVGWARVYLKQHSLAQVTVGAALGTTLTVAMTLLFRS
jgi:membrane-associated phospholipid phosphatase